MIRIFDYNLDGYIFKFNRNGKLYRVYESNDEKPWEDTVEGMIQVYDDLEHEDPENALSANQGVVLKELIDERYTKEETESLVETTVGALRTAVNTISDTIGDFRGVFPIETNTITSVLKDHEYNFDNLLAKFTDVDKVLNKIKTDLRSIKAVLDDIANPDIELEIDKPED